MTLNDDFVDDGEGYQVRESRSYYALWQVLLVREERERASLSTIRDERPSPPREKISVLEQIRIEDMWDGILRVWRRFIGIEERVLRDWVLLSTASLFQRLLCRGTSLRWSSCCTL